MQILKSIEDEVFSYQDEEKTKILSKYFQVQKTVGWMLREIGKRNIEVEKKFLNKNIKEMHSIVFPFSTEKLSKEDKENYVKLRKKDKL